MAICRKILAPDPARPSGPKRLRLVSEGRTWKWPTSHLILSIAYAD